MIETVRMLFSQIGKLFTWWATVYPWEQAVRVRLGKHLSILQPGIHLKIPMVHQIVKQNVRLFITNTPRQTLSTSDGKVVTLSALVGYKIVDIEELYMSIQNPADTINNMVMGAAANVVAHMHSSGITPDKIIAGVSKALGEHKWGLSFSNVELNDFIIVPATLRLIGDRNEFYTEQPNLHDCG